MQLRFKQAHPVAAGWNSATTLEKRSQFVRWRDDTSCPMGDGTRSALSVADQTIFIDEAAFTFHAKRSYVWGLAGRRAASVTPVLRAPTETLLLAVHKDGILKHKLHSSFTVQAPEGQGKYRGVNSILFREYLQLVIDALLSRLWSLPAALRRAAYIQVDNCRIHTTHHVMSLFNTLELARCYVLELQASVEVRGMYGDAACDSLLIQPRIHYVLQPPYSPFLNPCEFCFAEIRRHAVREGFKTQRELCLWVDQTLPSHDTPIPPSKLARFVQHCTGGRIRQVCRDQERVDSNDFVSVDTLNKDIYETGRAFKDALVEWRDRRLEAQRARRRVRETQATLLGGQREDGAGAGGDTEPLACVNTTPDTSHSPAATVASNTSTTTCTSTPRLRPAIEQAAEAAVSSWAATRALAPVGDTCRRASGTIQQETHAMDTAIRRRVLAMTGDHLARKTGQPWIISDPLVRSLWDLAAVRLRKEEQDWGPIVIRPPYTAVTARFADA